MGISSRGEDNGPRTRIARHNGGGCIPAAAGNLCKHIAQTYDDTYMLTTTIVGAIGPFPIGYRSGVVLLKLAGNRGSILPSVC